MRKHLHLFVAAILFPLGMMAQTAPSGEVKSGSAANKDLVIEVTLNSTGLVQNNITETRYSSDMANLDKRKSIINDNTHFLKISSTFCKHSAQAQYFATIDDAIVNAMGSGTFDDYKYCIKELIVKGTANMADFFLIQEMAGHNPYYFKGEELQYDYDANLPYFGDKPTADVLDAGLQPIISTPGQLRTITIDNINSNDEYFQISTVSYCYAPIQSEQSAKRAHRHNLAFKNFNNEPYFIPNNAFAETKLEKIILKSDKEITVGVKSLDCIQNQVVMYACAPRVHGLGSSLGPGFHSGNANQATSNSFRNADGKIDYYVPYRNNMCPNVKVYAPVNSICESREGNTFLCEDTYDDDPQCPYTYHNEPVYPEFTFELEYGNVNLTNVLPMLHKVDGYNFQTFSDFRAYDLSNVTGLFNSNNKIDAYYVTEFKDNGEGEGSVKPVKYKGSIKAGEGIMFNVDIEGEWFPLTPIEGNDYDKSIKGNLLKGSTVQPHFKYDHEDWDDSQVKNKWTGASQGFGSYHDGTVMTYFAVNKPMEGLDPSMKQEYPDQMTTEAWMTKYYEETPGASYNLPYETCLEIVSGYYEYNGRDITSAGSSDDYKKFQMYLKEVLNKTDSEVGQLGSAYPVYIQYANYIKQYLLDKAEYDKPYDAYNYVITPYRYDDYHTTDIVGTSNTAWYGLCDDSKFVLYYYDNCDTAPGYSTDPDRDNKYNEDEKGYIDEYIPEHRAYLDLSAFTTNQEVKAKGNWYVDFGSEITGIKDVTPSVVMDNAYYNLSGQRVAPNTKGILIHNGKKIFNK